MHGGILDLLPDIRTNNFYFRLGHTQVPGEESVGEAFKAFHNLKKVPGPDFFL